MRQAIIDLWNGNIAPVERCGSHDPELNQILDLIERNRETLCAGLTDVQREIFQKYIDCSEAYLIRLLELAFCDGFCLGGRLIMETLS